MRNLSIFGPELLCPQATPSPPSRIPLSSPIGSPVVVSLASPVTASPSTLHVPEYTCYTSARYLDTPTHASSWCAYDLVCEFEGRESCVVWREWDGCACECVSAPLISLSMVWCERCLQMPMLSYLRCFNPNLLVTSGFIFVYLAFRCTCCFLLMVAYFSRSSLAVAFLKTDLVSGFCTLFARFFLFVLFASTSHFDLPPISSTYLVPDHPFAPDRSFSRFPMLKHMSRMSLALYMLTIHILFLIPQDAHTRSFIRRYARLHTPSCSTLSSHCHSRSCHESFCQGWRKFSLQRMVDFSLIYPSPNRLFYSLLKLVDDLDLFIHQCILPIPSLLMNYQTGVITYSLTLHSQHVPSPPLPHRLGFCRLRSCPHHLIVLSLPNNSLLFYNRPFPPSLYNSFFLCTTALVATHVDVVL